MKRSYMLWTAAALSILPALAESNGVMPPGANPQGTSLTDMAQKLALFESSGNNITYYPDTPFQILFQDPVKQTVAPVSCSSFGQGILATGGNTFVVPPGEPFFVPLLSADDSPPVIGTFPATEAGAAAYFFGPTELGGKNFEIIVDGQSTSVGPAYVAGPVTTPPLLDGGGTHLIQLGVFLTPLSPGLHIVTIRGEVGGPAVFSAYGIGCVLEDYTYSVNVTQKGKKTVQTDRKFAEVYCPDHADGCGEVPDDVLESGIGRRRGGRHACSGTSLPMVLAGYLCIHPAPRE